jgi:uncharacterized OB-fold protein
MSELTIPQCANCGHSIWPPRLACPVCGAADWNRIEASTGVIEDVTETAGYDGSPVRLGTVRLDAGPPAIAAIDADAEPGEAVELELVDGALRARAPRPQK